MVDLDKRCTIAYPLQIENGTLKLSRGYECDRDAIFSVLQTKVGERIERPSYGTPDYVFSAVGSVQPVLGRIEAALTDQIPALLAIDVSGSINDAGLLDMAIEYSSQEGADTLGLRIRL